jgi:hypothetical protein
MGVRKASPTRLNASTQENREGYKRHLPPCPVPEPQERVVDLNAPGRLILHANPEKLKNTRVIAPGTMENKIMMTCAMFGWCAGK